jgi:hypothetical protein
VFSLFSFSDVLEDSLASPHDRPRTGSKKEEEVTSVKPWMKRNQDAARSTTSLLDEVIYETDDFETEVEVQPQAKINKAGRKSVEKRKDTPVLDRQQQQYVASKPSEDNEANRLVSSSSISSLPSSLSSIPARYVKIEFESTWGDRDYLGMTGVHILNPQGNPIKVGNKSVTTDQNSSLLAFSDERNVSNLNNNVNNTANDAFMWLIPYEPSSSSSRSSSYYVEFDLQSSQSISGLRLWNYNSGTMESSLRGCKYAIIYFDRKPYFRLILKPGIEYDGISFDQTIFFSHLLYEIEKQKSNNALLNAASSNRLIYKTPRLRQTYETANSPCGLLWKFSFYSNHGDDYYIGLDHIDLYDEENRIISLESYSSMMHIESIPHSIRDLAISSSDPLAIDPRIPEKLFTSKYFTDLNCKTNCWLAPLSKCMTQAEKDSCVIRTLGTTLNSDNYIKKRRAYSFPHDNTLFIMFDYPVTVSAIR